MVRLAFGLLSDVWSRIIGWGYRCGGCGFVFRSVLLVLLFFIDAFLVMMLVVFVHEIPFSAQSVFLLSLRDTVAAPD